MALYRDTGVVIRTWKLGEADRIVSIFTNEHGKVRGVAKGVRKSGSRFGARLEGGCHISVQLYKGRGELDTITQVELLSRAQELRDDYDLLVRAATMLEAVDHATPDREPNPALYQMLVRALDTLVTRRSPLVAPAFFLKLLALEGFEPVVDQCVGCETKEPLGAFDAAAGGMQCPACRSGPAVSADALVALRAVLGGRLSHALDSTSVSTANEVETLATRLIEVHLERRLRSAALIEHR